MITYKCDVCLEIHEEIPAARVKVDFRNTINNSGGKYGNEFHVCRGCRGKVIFGQYLIRLKVEEALREISKYTEIELKNMRFGIKSND